MQRESLSVEWKNSGGRNPDSPNNPSFVYSIEQTSDVIIELEASGAVSNPDPYLYLLNAQGVVIKQDDDTGTGRNAKLVYKNLHKGSYQIVAATYRSGIRDTGVLSWNVGDVAPMADEVTVNWENSGGRNPTSAHNPQYVYILHHPQTVTFHLISDNIDTFLYLLDRDGSVIASDNDSGATRDAKISKNLSENSGVYRVVAATYRDGQTGQGTLSASAGNFIQLPEAGSPGVNTAKLLDNLQQMNQNTEQIQGKVRSIDSTLRDSHERLLISKQVADNLTKLDNYLDTVSDFLSMVRIIPSISSPAQRIKRTIDTYRKPVTRAKGVAGKFERRIKPIRDTVEQMQQKTEQADSHLNVLIDKEKTFNSALDHARRCVAALPESSIKQQSQDLMETFSKNADPPVVTIDQVQVTILNAAQEVETKLHSIRDEISNLVRLNNFILNVFEVLHPFLEALTELRNALNHTIHVPYPSMEWQCKEVYYASWFGANWSQRVCGPVPVMKTWSFTIKRILDGLHHILQPVITALEAGMNAVLNPILDKLNLDLTLPEIPGLSGLESVFNSLINDIKGIISIVTEFNLKIEGLNLDALNQYLNELKKMYSQCLQNTKQLG